MSLDIVDDYVLLDCGDKKKIEKFGKYILVRPCPQALWDIQNNSYWQDFDLEFIRINNEKGEWNKNHKSNKSIPKKWIIKGFLDLKWQIEPNWFGNVGVFTEHWQYLPEIINLFDKNEQVLSLFSYTGSTSLPLVASGYKLTVVDSSKNAMTDYTSNLEINNLSREGQRLILEDVNKFILRENRRNNLYHSILVDAPSFGRGTKGEIFNIEDNLLDLLKNCKKILHPEGKLVFTSHSPRFTPKILEILVSFLFKDKKVEVREIINNCKSQIPLPSGFLVKVY